MRNKIFSIFFVSIISLVCVIIFSYDVYANCASGTFSCSVANTDSSGYFCAQLNPAGCSWNSGSSICSGSGSCSAMADSFCSGIGCGTGGSGGSGCTACTGTTCCSGGCVADSNTVCSSSSPPVWRCASNTIYIDVIDTKCNGVNTVCNGATSPRSVFYQDCTTDESTYCSDGILGTIPTSCSFSSSKCTDGANNNPTYNSIRDCQESDCVSGLSRSCTVGVGVCQRTGYQNRQCSGYTFLSGYDSCIGTPGSPGTEICGNGLDDDCDNAVDEDMNTYHRDADGDGHGFSSNYWACSAPAGYVVSSDDCNDGDAAIYTGNTEICDNKDNNCVGGVDEGFSKNWYWDNDRDGWYTSAYVSNPTCSSPGAQYSNAAMNGLGDCDNLNSAVWQNLNGYRDADMDGYTAGSVVSVCSGSSLPSGYRSAASASTDCDNNDAALWQNLLSYRDADLDTYTSSASAANVCSGSSRPAGYLTAASSSTDCDDSSSSIKPGATEICDAYDNDCSGGKNNGLPNTNTGSSCTTGLLGVCSSGTRYQYCDSSVNSYTWSSCSQTTASSIEKCDNLDNNCDGTSDEGCDNDNDDYCDSSMTYVGSTTCPNGGGDTNDTNSTVNPATNWYLDSDGDKYVTGSAIVQSASPGALYIYTGILGYSDCALSDGSKWQLLSGYSNSDLDAYVDTSSVSSVCSGASLPSGYGSVLTTIDCATSDGSRWQLLSGYLNDGDVDSYSVGPIVNNICSGSSLPVNYKSTNDNDCAPSDSTKWQLLSGYSNSDLDAYVDTSSVSSVCSGASLPSGYGVLTTIDCAIGDSSKWQLVLSYNDSTDLDFYTTNSFTLCTGSSIPAYARSTPLGNDCAPDDASKWQLLNGYTDSDGDGYTVGAIQSICTGATLPVLYKATSLGEDCNDADSILTTPDSCVCAPYVSYNTRIGFPESPTFTVTGLKDVSNKYLPIDKVCDLYSGVYKSANVIVVANGNTMTPIVRSNPSVTISSVSLPVCNNFASLMQYCNELGYDSYDATSVVSGSSGSCANGPSWTSSTDITTTSVSCKYDSMGSTYNVAFNLNIQGTGMQSYKYGCNGNDQGQTGADGVCVDDFSVVPVCGELFGLPVDLDCGVHTFMKHSYIVKSDASVVSIVPSVPSPVPHKACGVSNSGDCVTNVDGSLRCLSLSSQIFTGRFDSSSQPINITCSNSNYWCPKGYVYSSASGRCEFGAAQDCDVISCPGLGSFTIYSLDSAVRVGDSKYIIDGDQCMVLNLSTGLSSSCTTLSVPSGSTSTVTTSDNTVCSSDGSSMSCPIVCSGDNIMQCSVDGGFGVKYRSCSGSSWSDWSSCKATSCNSGYIFYNHQCMKSSTNIVGGSSGSTSCSGSNKQPCYVLNGIGYKVGTCTYASGGLWSWVWSSSCSVKECNSGYTLSNDVCVRNSGTPSYTTISYPVSNPVTFEKLVVSGGLSSFVSDNDCSVRTGVKIRGVCVASQTYPETKYSIQNIKIK